MISPEHLAFLAEFLRRRAGIELTRQRTHLIEGRLAPVARRFGYRDVSGLLAELKHAREALASAVTESMTTRDSAFFRDPIVFEQFRERVLPDLLTARKDEKRIRVWSAACAAGQEAYSLAMLLDEMKLAEFGWTIDLVASDLSSDQIARAEEGSYSDFEVERGVSAERLAAHFVRTASGYRVSDRLRRMVSFRTFNLLDSFGWLFDIDAVFCRNVLMFFADRIKLEAVHKISEILAPDGVLVLGHAEHVAGLHRHFARHAVAGFYTPKSSGKAGQQTLAQIA